VWAAQAGFRHGAVTPLTSGGLIAGAGGDAAASGPSAAPPFDRISHRCTPANVREQMVSTESTGAQAGHTKMLDRKRFEVEQCVLKR
jgi:hypothetical protein